MPTAINETFADTLILKDSIKLFLTNSVTGAMQLYISDQADPGMLDFSDPGEHALVSQVPVEIVIAPTDQHARVSQVPVEVVISAISNARLSQCVVEFVSPTAAGSLRGSQITISIF